MERFLKSRYRIGENISENPFSVTYQGNFIGTNKPVIIKIYKRVTLNSNLINRMKQKVKELSCVTYHGIAKLIDGDYGWQGFYYVREYVEGQSLQEILNSKQAIGAEKAQVIAIEVCKALEVVHAKGIIHGELKPSNVFISSKGMIKIADFVIEGEIKEAMPQKVISIMDNGNYTSPELLTGSPASVSSDIYALGLIIYEMLVSSLSIEKGLAGSLKRVKNANPINKEALAAFPRYLQEIVVKALQPDPLRRFLNAGEIRESLEKRNINVRSEEHTPELQSQFHLLILPSLF